MGYLEEIQAMIQKDDFVPFIHLWEEYCTNDVVDGEELFHILEMIKNSDMGEPFGPYAETALNPWKMIEDQTISHNVLRMIIDLETSNSQELARFVYQYISALYKNHEYFNEKIRLIGLRKADNFQGAIRNYELLTHLNKGNFAFHTGGWGAGEIVEVSLIREQLVLEFENVIGRKDLPFEQAFKSLVSIPNDHFLARRFGDPDLLEENARQNPLEIIHLLLRDLGPKTALEMKEELYELVIPANDWSKWWQTARAKLKKDTLVEMPAKAQMPFKLRKKEVSHKDILTKKLKTKKISAFIQTVYNFLRDFSETLKDAEFKGELKAQLEDKFGLGTTNGSEKMQIALLLQDCFSNEIPEDFVEKTFDEIEDLKGAINEIKISGLKKRALLAIKKANNNWADTFSNLLFDISPNSLKDYIFDEIHSPEREDLIENKISVLLQNSFTYPEAFVWYFQKVFADQNIPFNSKDDQGLFFETFLILLSRLEKDPKNKPLVKKMHLLICQNRFSLVRKLLKDSNLHFAKEFLLLITKCHILTKQDLSILRSLVEVEHASLAEAAEKEELFWATQEGFNRTQEKIKHIATVEVIENAREIEVARAHGDLRENAEYKFAQERRAQLQDQLKLFSDLISSARIVSPDDISDSEVGIGNVVTIEIADGEETSYTLLGAWEADVDKNILSFQSMFAQAMIGLKVGESFSFKEKTFVIKNISSYLA
jgi:transcription elongation factor GreA